MRLLTKLYTAAGAEQTPNDAGTFTLSNGTVYYAEFMDDIPDRTGLSVHWEYNAALVATITLEASNRPSDGPFAVTSYAAVGSGWATTSAAAVSPAASAGETVAHYADYMAARLRAKIDVTTGGTLRGTEHSKARGAR